MARLSVTERFVRKVDTSGDCWLWTAATNRDGYGSFWNGEWRGGDFANGPVMVLAHRWCYERYVGPIPQGLNVLHRCDVPGCVNPVHLVLGDQSANVRDAVAKGRWGRRFKKLSPELHDEIRRRYAVGDVSQDTLASEFGVRQATISGIVRADPDYQAMTPSQAGRRRVALQGSP